MRTRHFLTALCLPLAFAACTNEEFVSEGTSLDSRGKIDVVLTAARPSMTADTRLGIDGNNQFLWEKDKDMIGAALINGGTTIDGNVMTNYPFTAQIDGKVSTFNGKSSITQGKYFFYYSYQDILDRKGLSLEGHNQEYDVALTGKTALQQAASYMRLVSPIVDLAKGVTYKDAQTYNLNLQFANLYTVVQVNINSSNIPEGKTPKVTKITVDGKKSGNSAFYTNSAINFSVIDGAGSLSLGDGGQIDAEKQTEALEKLEAIIADGTIYTGKSVDGTTTADKGAYSLSVKGDLALDASKTTTLYVMVPKGKYEALDLTVETSEGTYKRTVEADDDIVLANAVQPIKADLNFSTGDGNVTLPIQFNIANITDWNAAIKFVSEHSMQYISKDITFFLTEEVKISEIPSFPVKIDGATGKILTLATDYTITKENESKISVSSNIKLAIDKENTLTVKTPSTKIAGEIVNYGTLNLAASVDAKISNMGKMNVTADITLTKGLTNGLFGDPTTNKSGNINISKALTITTGDFVNTNGNVTIAKGGELYCKALTGQNEANGKIFVEAGGVLKGDAQGQSGFVNSGIIDNFGVLDTPISNEATSGTLGVFIVEKDSYAKNSTTNKVGKGTVQIKDVTYYAKVQTDNDKKYTWDTSDAPTITATVVNATEYGASVTASIPTVTLASGDWTLASTGNNDDDKKIIKLNSATTGLILASANVKIEATTTANITVAGKSSIKAENPFVVTGDLTINESAALTIDKNVTFNEAAGNNQKAAINGKLLVKAGAAAYFPVTTVSKQGVLEVEGQSDTAAAGIFGSSKTDFKNAGKVSSLEPTKTGGASGNVTQPINENGAIFTGAGGAATASK